MDKESTLSAVDEAEGTPESTIKIAEPLDYRRMDTSDPDSTVLPDDIDKLMKMGQGAYTSTGEPRRGIEDEHIKRWDPSDAYDSLDETTSTGFTPEEEKQDGIHYLFTYDSSKYKNKYTPPLEETEVSEEYNPVISIADEVDKLLYEPNFEEDSSASAAAPIDPFYGLQLSFHLPAYMVKPIGSDSYQEPEDTSYEPQEDTSYEPPDNYQPPELTLLVNNQARNESQPQGESAGNVIQLGTIDDLLAA